MKPNLSLLTTTGQVTVYTDCYLCFEQCTVDLHEFIWLWTKAASVLTIHIVAQPNLLSSCPVFHQRSNSSFNKKLKNFMGSLEPFVSVQMKYVSLPVLRHLIQNCIFRTLLMWSHAQACKISSSMWFQSTSQIFTIANNQKGKSNY